MHIKRWLVSILLILLVIVSLGFVKFQQIQAAIAYGESFPEPSVSVVSTYVSTVEYARTTKVVGELRAPKLLTLSTEFAGPITYLGFAPGDDVEQGQVLIRQDVRIETANLNAAKARLKLAKSTFARRAKLLREKRISQDEVDSAEADVSIAEAEVANLSSVISKMTIVAPFSGRVGLEQFQVGQMLDANTQITSLLGHNPTIWVDFAVPQTLAQPNVGDRVTVELIRHGGEKLTARIIAKTPTVNAESRQQSYRAELDNGDGTLSPNQMVNVYVSETASQKVAVPTNAISRNHFGHFVYVLEQDDQKNWRAKPVKVETGPRVGDAQIIESGLIGGEFIATEGAFKLSEDLLVYTQVPDGDSASAGGR